MGAIIQIYGGYWKREPLFFKDINHKKNKARVRVTTVATFCD